MLLPRSSEFRLIGELILDSRGRTDLTEPRHPQNLKIGRGSTWVKRPVRDRKVAGSNSVFPTINLQSFSVLQRPSRCRIIDHARLGEQTLLFIGGVFGRSRREI